jgi:hypothetical protein
MARDGEYGALVQAGISPRRIGAIVVACALALTLVEAALACAFLRPAVRTEYAGTFGHAAGWAPGFEWLFIDVALLTADGILYRDAARPRTTAASSHDLSSR